MSTKIARISQIAKEEPKTKFTSIYQLIDKELLKECFDELNGNKAVGIDEVTKDKYRYNLEENLNNLVERLKKNAYRPTPAKRVNIPKANGKIRGLAIATFEDKIVQLAIKKLVEAIWEPKFTDNMFGFRPSKGCHDALRYLTYCIEGRCTKYILDADIKGYFDNIDHNKLMKALEMHIGDKRLLRLIKRFLITGIIENGKYVQSDKGTPQGSILSPVLANIYMYYTLILWLEKVKKKSRGYIEIINYADDMVICFQYKYEAERVFQLMRKRLKQCGLEFAEDKTRLIEFGRFAIENCKYKGKRKPDTFDFLGFTHFCSTDKTGKKFRVKRKTSKKKFKQKIQEFKEWIKKNRIIPLKDIMASVKRKLIGHYNYFGITDNSISIENYFYQVMKLLFKWLNRRSQRKSLTVIQFNNMINFYKIPRPKISYFIYKDLTKSIL